MADATPPTIRTSARYLNDRTRYPILIGRTVPQALGIGGGGLLLIATWNLAAGLGWDGALRVAHLVLLIMAAAGPYQVATILYGAEREPYARQHLGFARRWLWRRARLATRGGRAWRALAARVEATPASARTRQGQTTVRTGAIVTARRHATTLLQPSKRTKKGEGS